MTVRHKKHFLRALADLALAALFATAAFAADPEVSYDLVDGQARTTFEVASAAGFAAAVSGINAWTAARTVEIGGVQVPDSGVFTISLRADLTNSFGGADFSAAGTDTTILGNGHSVALGGSWNYFEVGGGAVLRLGKDGETDTSALDLTRETSNDTPGPLYANDQGTLHLYDGVVVHDCDNNNYFGGAVSVDGGLFHMHGGIIRNCGITGGGVCFGGGVAVYNAGRFIMDGGLIRDCYASTTYSYHWQVPSGVGGGVLVYGASSFIMNGGAIESCLAESPYGTGGGVAVISSYESRTAHSNEWGWLDSAFVMNGGTIRDCESSYMGGGVSVYGTGYLQAIPIGSFPPATGMIEFKSPATNATPEEAAAIAAAYAPAPGLWINGGTIEDCVTENYGGGVFLFRIHPSINVSIGAATISGCSAANGGGIGLYSLWTALSMDGTTVSGNTATDDAAGVFLYGNSSSPGTTMANVTITGNAATSADSASGGVYYHTDSILALSGSNTITGNTAGSAAKDSNLYGQGNACPFHVTGSLEGSAIGLTDPLLAAGGDAADTFLSSGYKANNGDVTPAACFTSDHAGWVADYDETGNEVRLVRDSEELTIVVRQRDDTDEPIILPDAWLEVLGLDHPGVTPEEIADAEDTLNAVQPNGCRYWENIVLGNAETNFLVATVPTNTADGIGFALPATDSSNSADFGYDVFYELRRDDGTGDVLQREADCTDLGLAFQPGDPTGLYRVWALVIPTNAAVTNAIPATNVIGVLRVESALTNTVTAVPWQALASVPQDAADIAAGAVVHPLNLSEGDRILAFDTAAGLYRIWQMAADGRWTPLSVVTMENGVNVTPAADDWSFAPGTGIWISRATPREGATANPYYLYGQMPLGAYAAAVAGGTAAAPKSTLCANPTAAPVELSSDTLFDGFIGADDTIVFNTASGASTVYCRNAANTAWGRYVKTVVNGRIRSTWTEDGVVAPGTGFWYVRRASGDLTVRWPGWAE